MQRKPDKILEVNVAYWTQAKNLINAGYAASFVRKTSIIDESKFYVIFRKQGRSAIKIVIDRKTKEPEAALIDEGAIYNMLATHSTESTFELPLWGPDRSSGKVGRAVIKIKQPNPNIFWTVAVDGNPIMGERSNLQSFEKLSEALRKSFKLGACTAEVLIPEAARRYFRERERRHKLINSELKRQGINLRQWVIANGLKYSSVYQVINRGDEAKEIRTKLLKLTGLAEDDLWPTIDWH
jgi:lambda repressor-like predicted transcriptional regulator